jgi:membrane associated rhomboid family serine protease
MESPVSIAIIAITCLISFQAFSNELVKQQLLFRPFSIENNGEWYRFLSSGLIHADWMHLLFNMISFWAFGPIVESAFTDLFDEWGRLLFVLYYVSAIVVADVPVYFKHRHNALYAGLGASGAVSAVILTAIFLHPNMSVAFLLLPFPMPGFVFAILYMGASAYMSERGRDNIAHDVHLYGAIYGLLFLIPFKPWLVERFIDQIRFTLGF